MKNYRKKPIIVQAEQWFEVTYDKHATANEPPIYHLNVGYFRRPDISGKTICSHCNRAYHDHGWIDTLEGGHNVCPCDWIITGVKGEQYPCKDEIFKMTYEEIM